MKVVLLENDLLLARAVQSALEGSRVTAELAGSADEALRMAGAAGHGALIVDLAVGQLADLIAKLRQKATSPLVVAIGEFNAVEDRLAALEAGADECFDRSCDLRELVAKVCVLLRRQEGPNRTLQIADLRLDRLSHTVTRQGRHIYLTAREYSLLEYLMLNQGKTLTRAMVMENVWNTPFQGLTNVVDVHIRCLRVKIDQNFGVKLIRTARGLGYSLVDPMQDPNPDPMFVPQIDPKPDAKLDVKQDAESATRLPQAA
ncbi:MAG TPA: response regulator transcription factor [Candidatus Angelobacter sp.]|nr:response regulator transcription factor [Candidatus Angelobacter sp.]